MFKQIIIKQDKTNPDPLTTGNNGVGNKPIGTYRQAKKTQMALAGYDKKNPAPEGFYTRENHREAVDSNIKARTALGQNASRFGDFMNSGLGQGLTNGISMATDIATQFIDRDTKHNPTGFDTQQKIGDALIKSGNPYAMVAGAAYKAISGIAEATGGNINTITKEQSRDVGVSGVERIANNVLGIISPGLGWIKGTEVADGQKSHLINEMTNAYADSVSDIDQAQVLGGGKYVFGRKKIADAVDTANRNNELLTNMNITNTQRKQSNYAQDLAQQNLNRYIGTNYMNTQVGRHGMKIQSLEEIRELLKNRVVEELDVQKFAEGGSILPVGQRHKTLHHMSELGEQFEDLTRKGIPVVTVDESGDMVQVAEIECSEACFSKEVTDQLELLWKDGSEEAMIAAGKLIANEILYNMRDENNVIWGSEEQQKNL